MNNLARTTIERVKMSFDIEKEYFEYFDWYDLDQVEKLNEKRAKQWLKLFHEFKAAHRKNNLKAVKKTSEALKRHEAIDTLLKRKAGNAGYYWI